MIAFIILIFSPFIFEAGLRAEVLLPSVKLEVHIPAEKIFDGIRDDYSAFKFPEAIRGTKKLIRQKKNEDVAKAAAFLLGDLYLDIAEHGRPFYYNKALLALQQARRKYRDSEKAVIALWKIGIIYMRKALHYEAVASFNRIIKGHPDTPMVVSARFAKAQTYVAMNKWKNAIEVYDEINPAELPDRVRMVLLLGYGGTYFELGFINTAYEYYKLVPVNEPILQVLPRSIFKYGIAALKSKDYAHSRKVLSILDNRYPGGPETLLALARMGDSWREQGMSLRANEYYKYVATFQKHDTNGQKGKMAAAIGQLHLAGCFPKPTLMRKFECEKMKALEREDGRKAIRTINEKAQFLLEKLDRSPHIEALLLEAAAGLERHKDYISALTIKESALAKKDRVLTPKTRILLNKSLRDTVLNAAYQFIGQNAKVEALTLYFRYNDFFRHGKIADKIALEIGINLTEAGFHQEAVSYLTPITGYPDDRHANKALFFLIMAVFRQENYPSAEKNVGRFLSRYPNDPRTTQLQALSAEISDLQGKMDVAIARYTRWLRRNPKDQNKEKIRKLLANAYEKQGELKKAIATTLRIEKDAGTQDAKRHLKLADLYFRIKDYKKAIPYYQSAREKLEAEQHKEWATLQLARSYEALGQRDKGSPLFTLLAADSKDDIIQGLAQQKAPRPQTP